MSTNTCMINFPRLHKALTSGSQPEEVLFLASVLFQSSDKESHTLATHMQQLFPLPVTLARQQARQLQEYGADLWDSKQLETMAVLSQNSRSEHTGRLAELRDIETFIAHQAKHSAQAQATSASSQKDEKIQHILLSKELALCIAYDLEIATLEAQEAITTLQKANAAFMTNLHDESFPKLASFAETAEAQPINLPYQTIFEALLPFMPASCILFTNDKETLRQLSEADIFLQYPPVEVPSKVDMLTITVPAGHLLTHKSSALLQPWASQDVTLRFPASLFATL